MNSRRSTLFGRTDDFEESASHDRGVVAFVVLCSVASFLLDSYQLGGSSVWGDEGASISIASQNGGALFHAISHDGGNLAFYYLCLHLIIAVFGSGTNTLRIFSVLCGCACVPLSFGLGATLVNRRCGVYCVVLTTMSLPLIYWSQQIRGYSLVVALLLGSALVLSRAIRDGGWRNFLGFAILGLLSCYTELLAGIVVAIQLLILPMTPAIKRRIVPLLLTSVTMAIALVPLVLIAHARGAKQLFWLGAPRPRQLRETAAFLASARVNGVTTPTTHTLSELTVILTIVACVVGLLQAVWSRSFYPARMVLLGSLWLVLPIAIAYSISIDYSPIFLDRYFLLTLPALTLLLGYLLSVFPIVSISWLVVTVIIVLRSLQIAPTYDVNIDDWRDATTMVVNESHPGDCVAFYFNDGFVDFSYYLEHRPAAMRPGATVPRSVLPALSFGAHPIDVSLSQHPAIVESYAALSKRQIRSVSSHCPTLFVISNHDGHNSATTGARAVWSRFVTMRNGLFAAYGKSETTNLDPITIFTFHHATSTTASPGSTT